MLKQFITFIALFIGLHCANAQCNYKVSLSYNEKDFSFSAGNDGALLIESDKYTSSFKEDDSEPGLPLIPANVLIPKGSTYTGFSIESTKHEIFDNVLIASNPLPKPTNVTATINTKPIQYSKTSYPNSNVEFIEKSDFDGYTMLRFLVCPFVYNNQTKKLYIVDNLTLNIKLNNISTYSLEDVAGGNNMAELANIISVNPVIPKDSIKWVPPTLDSDAVMNINYVIITSKDLVESFKPLALWKKQKGVISAITTIDEIKEKYPAKDVQLSIKSYLYDMYKHKDLKYALLGGDDAIVPVRGCHVECGSNFHYNDMPTDLYYACFGKDLTWDANNNGIYGELTDSINMNPSIFVTRAPVRTAKDAEVFVNKVIGYEKEPTKNGWNNSILMLGHKLFGMSYYDESQSDAKAKGDYLYDNHIKPYWDGTRTRLYDTYTDIDNIGGNGITKQDIQNQLQNGFHFVDMITHGAPDSWMTTDGTYTRDEASNLVSPQYSIITTNACFTNAFDYYKDEYGNDYGGDLCLSESFIRNPQSGVVAYLGCSREGWDYKNSNTGPSLEYEQEYYKYLFSPSIKEKNFGKIVAAAKQTNVSFCKYDGPYRWIQFGLNPVGDPEMPIYTSTPKEIMAPMVLHDNTGKSVHILTLTDSCTFCATDAKTGGESYFHLVKNANEANFDNLTEDEDVVICITKQNHIPFIVNVRAIAGIHPINKFQKCASDKNSGKTFVSIETADDTNERYLLISTINGDKEMQFNVPKGSYSAYLDTSTLKSGVHIVSLYVDGKLIDSKTIIK